MQVWDLVTKSCIVTLALLEENEPEAGMKSRLGRTSQAAPMGNVKVGLASPPDLSL